MLGLSGVPDLAVRPTDEPLVHDGVGVVPQRAEARLEGCGQILVELETQSHARRWRSRQVVPRSIRGERDDCANILLRQAREVLQDIYDGITVGEAGEHRPERHARSFDDGLSATGGRITNDARPVIHGPSSSARAAAGKGPSAKQQPSVHPLRGVSLSSQRGCVNHRCVRCVLLNTLIAQPAQQF